MLGRKRPFTGELRANLWEGNQLVDLTLFPCCMTDGLVENLKKIIESLCRDDEMHIFATNDDLRKLGDY